MSFYLELTGHMDGSSPSLSLWEHDIEKRSIRSHCSTSDPPFTKESEDAILDA